MTNSGKAARKVLPRDQGGSIELKEGTGGIIAMCPCGDFIEIYKEDTTFRFQTPESIDPERTNPDAPFVASVTDKIGSSNLIIARALLQGRDIVEAAIFDGNVDNQAVVRTLHSVKECLVVCYKASDNVTREVDAIIGRAESDGILTPGRVVPSLPQVPDLESEATRFLISATRAIKNICSLVPLFLQVDAVDNNFDHLATRLKKSLGSTALLTEFVNAYADVSRYLITLRNWQEHQKPTKRTHVDNFRVLADGSIAVPMWYISGETPRPIKEEMAAAINLLIEMTEIMLIRLVMERVDKRWPLIIQELDVSRINPANPIRYRLTIDMSRFAFPSI